MTTTATKRFYWKLSVLYEAYAVYDSSRKNPDGNDYLIASSDDLDFTNCEELCDSLNNGDKELLEMYGLN